MRVTVEEMPGYRCTKCRSPRVQLLTQMHRGQYKYSILCCKCDSKTRWAKCVADIQESAAYHE